VREAGSVGAQKRTITAARIRGETLFAGKPAQAVSNVGRLGHGNDTM